MREFYSGSEKMASLVNGSYKTIKILSRLGIKPGFGENSVSEVCQSNAVSPYIFLSICNVSDFHDYKPNVEGVKNKEVSDLVRYLRLSHNEFINKDIPSVEFCISKITSSEGANPKHSDILKHFFEEYREELESHFNYEEKTVFPYVTGILSGVRKEGYSIEKFEENHTNIEAKLSDLKNILLKYLPAGYPSDVVYEVLAKLFLLEEEFENHAHIEDRLLVPLVAHLEKTVETSKNGR